MSAEWIEILVSQRIPSDGVHGEVAPAGRLLERQHRITVDREALVAAAGLRLASRQRHVNGCYLEYGETLADRLHVSEWSDDLLQPFCGYSEDFDVEILGIDANQAIADETADDKRPAARGPNGVSDVTRT